MKRFIFIVLVIIFFKSNAQTYYLTANAYDAQTNNYNATYKFSINNCDTIGTLYTCLDTYGDYSFNDMAIDTAGNLYWVTIEGALYTSKLNDSASCQFLGVFDNDSAIQGLVANVSGDILAIGTNDYNNRTKLYEYQPKTKTFTTLGILPDGFIAAGDLFFYEGRLFYTSFNFLVEINLDAPSQSCNYMNIGDINAYATFSIQNGTCSDAYVVGNSGGISSLYKLDLYSKTISEPICTYNFVANGGASVYNYLPSIIDSNKCLPVDSTACTTMPVTSLNFTSTLLNKTVQLQWQTTSEINSSYFLIERSSDDINFSTIGKVNAAGNSTALKQYSFIDQTPLGGEAFYRLKEVDLDGKYVYSKILLIKMPQANTLNIIGNPVQNVLQIQINNSTLSTNYLSIFDFSGRRLKTFNAQSGLQNIDVSFLSAGSYILQLITADGKVFDKPFVKR
jgi:hypothetical protein